MSSVYHQIFCVKRIERNISTLLPCGKCSPSTSAIRFRHRSHDRLVTGAVDKPVARIAATRNSGVGYNGRRPWRTARRLSDLVGPATRPAELSPAVAPTFAGESYVLIDLQELAAEDLPPDNVVSLLARAHGIRDALGGSQHLDCGLAARCLSGMEAGSRPPARPGASGGETVLPAPVRSELIGLASIRQDR